MQPKVEKLYFSGFSNGVPYIVAYEIEKETRAFYHMNVRKREWVVGKEPTWHYINEKYKKENSKYRYYRSVDEALDSLRAMAKDSVDHHEAKLAHAKLQLELVKAIIKEKNSVPNL